MTKDEARKKLNQYTKEEIIEGIVTGRCYRKETKDILNAIEYYVEKKRIDDEQAEFERVTDNSIKATNKYIAYTKELIRKYGNDFKLNQLTKEEFDKLLKVTEEYEKAEAEYYDNLENDLKR